jgi:hypothetical protein
VATAAAGVVPEPEDEGNTSVRAVLRTVLLDVVLPFSTYLALHELVGMPNAAALATAGGVPLIHAAVSWFRSHEVQALAMLLVVRFFLGVALAGLTHSGRLVLAKDSLVTGGMGLFVLATLWLAKPFIYHIRRGMAPSRERWDTWWDTSSAFRHRHRQMTIVWGAGLLTDAVVRLVVIWTTPIEVAALVSQAMAALSIVALVAWTQRFGRGISTEPDPVPADR